MENVNNQIEAEVKIINSDVKYTNAQNDSDKILLANDIKHIMKQKKIEAMLLDKENAKNNLNMFLARKNKRLNGEKHEVYNSAA